MTTLLFLAKHAPERLHKMTLEELAHKYQQQDQTEILSEAFRKCSKLVYATASKFKGLTTADIDSFALERLHFCLLTYNSEAKFSTYFTNVFYNKLREETQALSTHKRKANMFAVSFEKLVEESNFDIPTSPSNYTHAIEAMRSIGVSERDICICLMLAENYSKVEIANKYKISSTSVSNAQKRVQKIISTSGLFLQT